MRAPIIIGILFIILGVLSLAGGGRIFNFPLSSLLGIVILIVGIIVLIFGSRARPKPPHQD